MLAFLMNNEAAGAGGGEGGGGGVQAKAGRVVQVDRAASVRGVCALARAREGDGGGEKVY
jgi:hypothetical protein